MNNEKKLGATIAFCFWLIVTDIVVENPMPALAVSLASSLGTLAAIYLPSIVMRYGKE